MDVEVMFLLGVVVFTVIEFMIVHFMARKDIDSDKDEKSMALSLDQWCRRIVPATVLLGSISLIVTGFIMGADTGEGKAAKK